MKTIFRLFLVMLCLVTFTATAQYKSLGDIRPETGSGFKNDLPVIKKALETYKSIFVPRTQAGYMITGILHIPAGCRIVFDVGAKFIGTGTINGNGTQIQGQGMIFASGLSFTGTFAGPYVDEDWFESGADYTAFSALITPGLTTSITPSAAWDAIDTANGDLDMNSGNIISVNALIVESVIASEFIGFNQEEHNVGVVNEVDTIDWGIKNAQTMDLTDTCEFTFLSPTYPCHLQLKIIHDNTATNYPVTFSNSIKWEGGAAYVPSSSANAVDIISIYFDDTNYYATPGNDFK